MKICHLQILLTLLLVVTCDVVPPLSCYSPFRERVFLELDTTHIPQLLKVDRKEKLVLEAVNIGDNTIAKSVICDFREEDTLYLRCMLWRLKTIPPEAEYQLRLTTSNSTILWRYSNNTFKLKQDLYHCFEHSFEIFSSYDVNDTSIQVQWRTRRGDEAHNLIKHHTITVESEDGKQHGGRVSTEQCELVDAKRLCYAVVTGLKPCTEYRICVESQFIGQTHHQCIEQKVLTLCSHIQGDDPHLKNIFIYAVAGAIAFFLGVLGFILIRRGRSSSSSWHDNRCRDEAVQEQDMVMPRVDGPEYAEIPEEDVDGGCRAVNSPDDYFVVSDGTSPIL